MGANTTCVMPHTSLSRYQQWENAPKASENQINTGRSPRDLLVACRLLRQVEDMINSQYCL